MGSVANLLSENSTKFISGVGDWVSGTNQLTVTRTRKREESNSSSLRIYDSNGLGASALVSVSSIPETYDDYPIRGFTWVNSDKSGNVDIYLTSVSGGASTTVNQTVAVIANTWTLLSVQLEQIPAAVSTLILRIATTDLDAGDSIYLSRPAMMSPWFAADSVFPSNIWLRLPEYLQTTDKNQTDPDVPLFRFIESLYTVAEDINTTWEDFRWIPPEENDRVIKESGLVSPNAALPPALLWMAQVNGSQLLDPTAAFTPWLYLDNDDNPDTPITWASWLAELDADVSGTVTWDEIQNYNPAIFDLTSAFRVQVNGAFYGYRAGTKQSIIAAAKTVDNVQTVELVPRYLGDPFHIKVEILTSEGGDPVDVERALERTTPAGYQITVVSV